MRDIKKVLICGIGAIGSIYANKIQKYDAENLRILVDKSRFEKYSKNPIIFNGKQLNFNYLLPDNNDFKADLIIIATKFDGLSEAIENIKNFVSGDTIIMSFLNGVTSEKIIAQIYGREKVINSFFIGHSAVRHGRNIVHDDDNNIVFGAENSKDFGKVDSVKAYFDKVGINYKISDDVIHDQWSKFMLNVGANQISAVLKMTFGEMLNNKKCMDMIVNLIKEVQAVAQAEGVKNSDTMLDETIEHLHTMLPEGRTSMLQDVEAKRKTEVDMFAGTVIELGLKHNIQTPYNKVIKEMIEVIQENY